jgi:hypothetical protein
MDIVIERIANSEDMAAMLEVWKQVFEREMGITLPQDSTRGDVSHWLARLEHSWQAIGTLSVVNTTGADQLHDSLGLRFDPQARVARFTHLAVLKHYRGMNIPLAMMLEAHRSVIVPGQFDHTWLLVDVENTVAVVRWCAMSAPLKPLVRSARPSRISSAATLAHFPARRTRRSRSAPETHYLNPGESLPFMYSRTMRYSVAQLPSGTALTTWRCSCAITYIRQRTPCATETSA